MWPQEYKKMYDVANKRQQFTMSFLLGTGARIREAQNVKVEDIDFVRKYVILRVTKVRAKLKETRPSPRPIPISTQLSRRLTSWVKEKNLSSTSILKIHTTEGVDAFLKEVAQKAGIKDYQEFSAHNLRKTTGTYLLALGIDGFKVAQFLGHSAEMLRTRYASPDIFSFKDKDEMKEILGDLYTRMRST